MDRDVFSKKKVGDYYNTNFISTKLYDTHEMGSKFASKYNVDGFPTMLFLDSKGKLIYSIDGAVTDVNSFISEGKSARAKGAHIYTNKGGQNNQEDVIEVVDESKSIEELVEEVERKLDEYEDYTEAFNLLVSKPGAFDGEESIYTIDLILLLMNLGDEDALDQFLAHRSVFFEYYEYSELLETFMMAGYASAFVKINEMGEVGVDFSVQEAADIVYTGYKKIFVNTEKSKGATAIAMLSFLLEEGLEKDGLNYLKEMIKYTPSLTPEKEEKANFYSMGASIYLEYFDGRGDLLEEVLLWAKKSVELSPTSINYTVLADVYEYKGDEVNAQKYQRLAEKAAAEEE